MLIRSAVVFFSSARKTSPQIGMFSPPWAGVLPELDLNLSKCGSTPDTEGFRAEMEHAAGDAAGFFTGGG